MWAASCKDRTASGSIIWTGSSTPVRMCRLVLVMTLLSMNIQASSQVPPRLGQCRTIVKTKENEDYVFTTTHSCDQMVSLPLSQDNPTNMTDTRNCANYYKCAGASCDQCPCPEGQTFNPVTKRCDITNSPCECPMEETTLPVVVTTPTTTIIRTTPTSKAASTTTRRLAPPQIIQDAGAGSQQSGEDNSQTVAKPVSTEVIIIAGIVSATVIVIVVIVMAVFCWQRRHSAQLNSRVSKPVMPNGSKKLSSPSPDSYSTSIPPTERHEYAEIDERMINSRKHWQHGGSMRAPPLPNHQPPPTSPTFTGVCPHQRSDSGLGSVDTSFTANYPRRTFQPINPAHTIQVGIPYNERQPGACCCNDVYHNQEDSSASSDSQYSNPVSVDSRDVDLKTPLHKQNYVSKQVYI